MFLSLVIVNVSIATSITFPEAEALWSISSSSERICFTAFFFLFFFPLPSYPFLLKCRANLCRSMWVSALYFHNGTSYSILFSKSFANNFNSCFLNASEILGQPWNIESVVHNPKVSILIGDGWLTHNHFLWEVISVLPLPIALWASLHICLLLNLNCCSI